MRTRCLGLAIVGLLLAGAASAQDCGAPAARDDGWAIAPPEAVGLDPARVCAIEGRLADGKANIHAVLVARNGTLVFERYFTGADEIWGRPTGTVTFDPETKHDVRSISKSVTSLVFGIALGPAAAATLDAPVFDFFPEYAGLRTPEKDRILVRHLLTMSAGLAWDETRPYTDPENSEIRMIRSTDPHRFVLEQPVALAAGQRYNYSGGSATLLAAIVEKISGRPFDDFARTALFEPLGITDTAWIKMPNSVTAAASGLRLKPRDLAKLGQLVLARGQWQGRLVAPATWIDQSIAPQISGASIYFYGYQWWLG
ncbi:MAG: serine hydrolase, partial [Proteobacteria bacterium]|nr:serine hydrolase [Pseudomonadota bacterium]